MRYYIPEWDDRIDTEYDFLADNHSERHNTDPKSDSYMWQIFDDQKIPFDGLLISLEAIDGNNGKAKEILARGGLRKYLGLPEQLKILADCGAWGYLKDPKPPYDPVKVLGQYERLGVQEAVTVDHLVLPNRDPEKRMEITQENGIKGFDAWKAGYRSKFDLLVSVQGLEVSDYVKMFEFYSSQGVTRFAFGGLARKPSPFIHDLISRIVGKTGPEVRTPERVHFFGLGRPELFPRFSELERKGISVSFDTSSWLRRAWLNGHYYAVENGKLNTYTSVRVELVDSERSSFRGKRKLGSTTDLARLQQLEGHCLEKIRGLAENKSTPDEVIKNLASFHRKIIEGRIEFFLEKKRTQGAIEEKRKELEETERQLARLYPKTLVSRPWQRCECRICKRLGVEVIMLRGNNRNRARGFHNVYTMYHEVIQRPDVWGQFERSIRWNTSTQQDLVRMDGRVLVIAGCTKTKLGYTSRTRARAGEMYRGRLFRVVKNYALTKHFPLLIISAKYGLIRLDDVIGGYEKVIANKHDVQKMKPLVTAALRKILPNFDKVVVIAGEKYRMTLAEVWDDRFSYVKAPGYAKLAQVVERAVQEIQPKLVQYV